MRNLILSVLLVLGLSLALLLFLAMAVVPAFGIDPMLGVFMLGVFSLLSWGAVDAWFSA